MEIKALTGFAGVGFSAASGQVISCPDDVAEDLIRAGFAEKVGKTAKEVKEEKKDDDQRSDNDRSVPATPRKRSRAK